MADLTKVKNDNTLKSGRKMQEIIVYHPIMYSGTCTSCVKLLTSYVNFAITCQGTEEKINFYRETEQDESITKLSNILIFLSEDTQYNNVNIKKKTLVIIWSTVLKSPTSKKKWSCIHVKRVNIKPNINETILRWSCMDANHVSIRQDIKKALIDIFLIHRKNSEVEMYTCETCQYETKRKENLKSHLLVHREYSEVEIYACETCNFKTKYKISLRRHLLVHKQNSKVEIKAYACERCEYKTKHKSCLTRHAWIHRKNSEVKIYTCETCRYKTKHKGNLKIHLWFIKKILKWRCIHAKRVNTGQSIRIVIQR
ncbi:hypothetical protein NQ317_004135 [Molorchus minor]|uniref:C2H2-type domain-containing protein n=1 Tax=Molorchus minor TaxID=1323400 RepID=A0ABQ9J549_9CUCU|nr:hypothetical protein NQ317_004135 [Molorchus minor]